MCISRAGISSLIGDRAKYKDKVLDVSDSNQNVETTSNSKLKLTGLKDIFITVYMHIANTIKLWNFSGIYHFRVQIKSLLSYVKAFTVDTFYYCNVGSFNWNIQNQVT